MNIPVLSILIFFPLIAAVLVLLMKKDQLKAIKIIAVAAAALEFFGALPLYFLYDASNPSMQMVERFPWITGWGIEYHVGIDGISLLLVLLTVFISFLSIVAAPGMIGAHLREFLATLLFLETSMIGVFVSLDLFLFYVFWELMLVPMYLVIGIWGGKNRIYAAVKFFIYTMAGSVLMLIAILVLYFDHHASTGEYTFNLLRISAVPVRADLQLWLFLAFFGAFAVKVPMFPLHTWLPDAHVEAPTAGSVILAAILLKMGTYGILRFVLPLFPLAVHASAVYIIAFALVGIVYGAFVAMVQKDVKKLVAYSSVSHMGVVVLGIFALNSAGLEGGILQMINHGLSTGALFLLIGVLYERRHTRLIADYGGIAKVVPLFTVIFMIVTFSSIGLPGLNGFVGEFLVLAGAFQANPLYGVIAATGVILSAVYMLWMVQRVLFGQITHEENRSLKDVNAREIFCFLPILTLILWIGVYPETFLSKVRSPVSHILDTYSQSIRGNTHE